jgi:Lrp/AsnC family leucine-responsive transcriptional regulator
MHGLREFGVQAAVWRVECARYGDRRRELRMDSTDWQILEQLQLDATASHGRIQRMSDEGVIRGQVALLDHEALGLGVEAYVTVKLASYARRDVQAFHQRIKSLPSIVECCSLTGGSDYLLRVLSTDLKAFNELINRDLLDHGDVASVRSSIVLDRIKRTMAIPLIRDVSSA